MRHSCLHRREHGPFIKGCKCTHDMVGALHKHGRERRHDAFGAEANKQKSEWKAGCEPVSAPAAAAHVDQGILRPDRPTRIGTARTVKVPVNAPREAVVYSKPIACSV